MDRQKLEDFVSKLNGFSTWTRGKQTDYFAFFLTNQEGLESFTGKEIDDCFKLLSLNRFSRLKVYLSEEANSAKGKYIKQAVGYRLSRAAFEAIKREIEQEPLKIKVSIELENLIENIVDPFEKSFLKEALNCYSVGANRAAIIMSWTLTMHHLQTFIFQSKLADFNQAIAKNPDKKLRVISNMDDFSNLAESKFIELARSANILTNDIRKILDEKLGTRNTAAHPSIVVISQHKTTEFISDLVNNVLLRY